MRKTREAKIIQNEAKPVEKNILAQSIVRISAAADDLRRSSGLNDRALIILISASSKVGKEDVGAVLRSLQNLKSEWCR